MLKGPHVKGSFTICVIWLIIVQKFCCVCGDSLEIVESACVVMLKLDFKICCCFLVWTRTMRISLSFTMRLVSGNVILVLGYGSCTLACRVLRKRERLNIGFVEVQELDFIFKCLTSFSRVSVC